jgi:hypothetical protein
MWLDNKWGLKRASLSIYCVLKQKRFWRDSFAMISKTEERTWMGSSANAEPILTGPVISRQYSWCSKFCLKTRDDGVYQYHFTRDLQWDLSVARCVDKAKRGTDGDRCGDRIGGGFLSLMTLHDAECKGDTRRQLCRVGLGAIKMETR